MADRSSLGMSSPSSGQKRKEREAGEEEGEVEQPGVRRKLSEEFKAVQTPKRKAAGETESPGSSATKFYRLDYLFGKSSEKVARQVAPARQYCSGFARSWGGPWRETKDQGVGRGRQ